MTTDTKAAARIALRPSERGAGSAAGTGGPQEISRRLVLLLAVACGATVANLYYVQPLLNVVGDALGVSDATAGLLVTLSQVGYALGLALLVPLGDLLERRRLITGMLLGAAMAAAACAAAPSFLVLAAALAGLVRCRSSPRSSCRSPQLWRGRSSVARSSGRS